MVKSDFQLFSFIKKYLLVFIFSLFFNCSSKKEKKEELNYPLQSIQVQSILLEGQGTSFNDSLLLNKLSLYLRKLTNQDLIKGRRLHGASKMCDLILKSTDREIQLFVSKSQKNEMVVNFLEFEEKDNFTYSLRALYNSNEFLEIIDEIGIECKD